MHTAGYNKYWSVSQQSKNKKVKRSGVVFLPSISVPLFSVAVKSPAKGRAGFRGDDGRDAPAVCNGEISEWQLLFSSQQLEEAVRWGEGFITERTRQSEKKKRRTKGFTSHMLAIFKSVKCDHARIIRKNDHKTARQIALVINLTLVFKISEAFRVVCKSRFLREHSYIYPCSLICYINMCSLLSKFVDNTPTI